MMRGPSRDASHDGASTEARAERGAGTKRGGIPNAHARVSAKRRVPKLLLLLHLLALAIVTVVCAGIASPAPAIASPAAPLEVVAPDSANAVRALARQSPHPSRDCAARPADAAEADIDDDGETPFGVADDPAPAFKDVWLQRRPAPAWRGEPRSDTSRLAIGSCRPRGPPT